MRDEGAIFGGEVSGHYYFHDFYNADSGTIPALLILEMLGRKGATLSELLEPYRVDATSSPARSTPRSTTRRRRWPQIEERYSDAEQRPRRRRLGRLRRLALQRARLEHRAAAAPDARVASSRRRTWRRQRDEVLGLIRS